MKARSISNTFMDSLLRERNKENTNGFNPLIEYVKSDGTLDLEMRGDRVIVYYRGGKILALRETGTFEPLDKKYGKGLTVDWENLSDYIPKAKHMIDDFQTRVKSNLGEKEISQRIVLENNYSPYSNDTDYYIADMEYSQGDGENCQFDLIGIKWLSTSSDRKKLCCKVAVIETKQGIQTLRTSGTNPGLKKHYDDFVRFSKGSDFNAIIEDFVKVFCMKCELGLIKTNKKITRDTKFTIEPEAEFIAVLANYKPASENLKNELKEFAKGSKILFATSNYMGYGLYHESLIPFGEMTKRFNLE